MIVLSSPAAVKDIMDKNGTLTAGRPRSLMQLTADGLHMILENAGELTPYHSLISDAVWHLSIDTGVWRRARKAFQMFLTAEAVDRHLPTQEAESIQMLHDLLTSPEVCLIRLYFEVLTFCFSRSYTPISCEPRRRWSHPFYMENASHITKIAKQKCIPRQLSWRMRSMTQPSFLLLKSCRG